MGLVFLCFTIHAVLLAKLNSVAEIGPEPIEIDVAIILVGMFLVFSGIKAPWTLSLAKGFVYYSLIVVGFTVVIGGLHFNPLPVFNLEYGSDQIGREEDYSLGLSYFFGLSAIAAVLLMTSELRLRNRFLYGIFCLAFIFLCVLGGGRGEIIATLVVVLLVVLSRLRFITGAALIVIFVIFGAIVFSLEGVETFSFYKRFSLLLDGNLSTRDTLLIDVFMLLQDYPDCLIWGCGLGYFQHYYGYNVGLYPHNSIAEAVIVFGLPVTIVTAALYARGIIVYRNRVGEIDMLLAFSIYAALVSLKSQSLYGSWIFLVSILIFFWIGIAWRGEASIKR
ncbi:MAG: hypothetical protein OQL20_03730, partial [Sedimenticola sp.]|nr:hypothetical protein [Sedimenticola sp.]